MVWRNHIEDSVRLAIWRRPLLNATKLSLGEIMLVFVVVGLEKAVLQFSGSEGWSSFSPYGLNSLMASATVSAVAILLFSRVDPTPGLRRALVLLLLMATTVYCVALGAFPSIVHALVKEPQRFGWSVLVAQWILMLGLTIWWVGAARQAFRSTPDARHPLWRAVAFVVCLHLLNAALPLWPVFPSRAFDRSTANLWESLPRLLNKETLAARDQRIAAWKEEERRSVSVEAQQPRRLEAALAAVAPRTPDKSNIFLIGVSGYSEQDVFQHETERSLDILKSKFGIGDHVLALVNAQDTTDRYPIASIQNLAFVLREVGKRMDREKDVLVLTMTSHGSSDGFALVFKSDIYRTLSPAALKSLLDEAKIKNRVLIVAACYSGVFVPVLADPDTMIMTAASATRTSFGCANGREWTYFGDAFFAHGLKTRSTLAAAFEAARGTIGQWETEGHISPSDPQIFVGEAIARRFPQIVGVMGPGGQQTGNPMEGRSAIVKTPN